MDYPGGPPSPGAAPSKPGIWLRFQVPLAAGFCGARPSPPAAPQLPGWTWAGFSVPAIDHRPEGNYGSGTLPSDCYNSAGPPQGKPARGLGKGDMAASHFRELTGRNVRPLQKMSLGHALEPSTWIRTPRPFCFHFLGSPCPQLQSKATFSRSATGATLNGDYPVSLEDLTNALPSIPPRPLGGLAQSQRPSSPSLREAVGFPSRL